MFDRFLSTLALVSRIKVKLPYSFDPSRMDFYLPVAGIFPAVLGGLGFLLGYRFIDQGPVTVILVLIVQYLSFNLFHLDGLADTADAFLGAFDREKRKAILKDSRLGVYGFFAAFFVLALKIALLQGLFPLILRFPAAVLAYPISGRLSAALIPAMSPPMSPQGLGALAKDSRLWRAVAGGLSALALWAALVYGGIGLSTFLGGPLPSPAPSLPGMVLWALPLVSPLPSRILAGLYGKHLGGYTGDALGAAVELGELLHLGAAFAFMRVFVEYRI
ncbi:MAG: adenosylcobinamide-GDP ribazoletransferase [Spirochaetaceae bacterium]|jgi:adenosylcobinamide-GDP ribazoletransferase|nr:adenosylcobinamide-GDP ribazoletransferase [Spirochaetaceae bacterium]